MSSIWGQANPTGVTGYANTTETSATYGVWFTVAAAGTLTGVWFYSPQPGNLPTATAVWSATSSSVSTLLNTNASPSWSGAAGTGWIQDTSFPATAVSPGTTYVAAYYIGASSVNQAFIFSGSSWFPQTSGDGNITAPLAEYGNNQAPFGSGGSIAFPTSYNGSSLNWLADVQITFTSAVPPSSASRQYAPGWHPGTGLPGLPGGAPFAPWPPWDQGWTPPTVTVTAGLATGTGAAQNATVSTVPVTNAPAGAATGTGTSQQPSVAVTVNAGLATGTGAAQTAGIQTSGAYRLFPATNGPGTATSFSGSLLTGVVFEVTTGGMWFEGYWWWVAASAQSTSPQKFALWSVTSISTGVVIPAATVTSGTLTAGQWNYVPLAAPVQLAIGSGYVAATGVNGNFPDTASSFGGGDTYSAGITNGPLNAYGDSNQGGTNGAPYDVRQGVFSTAASDPSVVMPFSNDSTSDNFWVDIQVSGQAPPGYGGSWRLWPNKSDTNDITVPDSAVNYTIATEIHLAQPCTLGNIWYYSPAGTAQLATRCDVWSIGSQLSVASISSPSWSGAAGTGWVSAPFAPGTVIPGGSYRVSVYNGAATPDEWSAKDATTSYWATGAGANGITSGPVSAPNLSGAALAYEYNAGDGGATPPFSNGSQEAGQCVFAQGPPNQYPYLYVDGLAQNYWVDLEATPSAAPVLPYAAPYAPGWFPGAPGNPAAGPFAAWPPWDQAPAPSATAATATAGLATGTGSAQQPVAATGPNAAVATGTGTSQAPVAALGANAGDPAGTGTAQAPMAAITVNAGLATGTGAAQTATVNTSGSTNAVAGLASGTGTAQAPAAAIGVNAAAATGTATAQAATGQPGHNAAAGLATGTGTAQAPPLTLVLLAQAQAATALGAALNATGNAVEPFTVGTLTGTIAPSSALTSATAPGGSAAGTITPGTQRTGGPS